MTAPLLTPHAPWDAANRHLAASSVALVAPFCYERSLRPFFAKNAAHFPRGAAGQLNARFSAEVSVWH